MLAQEAHAGGVPSSVDPIGRLSCSVEICQLTCAASGKIPKPGRTVERAVCIHIRCAMGNTNMTTFSAPSTRIKAVKGIRVARRRAGVRYLRWAIRRAVYRDPASPSASRMSWRTCIVLFAHRGPGSRAGLFHRCLSERRQRWNKPANGGSACLREGRRRCRRPSCLRRAGGTGCARRARRLRGISVYPNLAKFLTVFSRFPREAIFAARASDATGTDTPTARQRLFSAPNPFIPLVVRRRFREVCLGCLARSARTWLVVPRDELLARQLSDGRHDGVGGLASRPAGGRSPQMAEVQRLTEPDGNPSDPQEP